MNHTKAMLTDILLHLRKRAERGIRFGGSWQHGRKRRTAGSGSSAAGTGSFAGGRGPVGRLLRPWRNTPESISFPGLKWGGGGWGGEGGWERGRPLPPLPPSGSLS